MSAVLKRERREITIWDYNKALASYNWGFSPINSTSEVAKATRFHKLITFFGVFPCILQLYLIVAAAGKLEENFSQTWDIFECLMPQISFHWSLQKCLYKLQYNSIWIWQDAALKCSSHSWSWFWDHSWSFWPWKRALSVTDQSTPRLNSLCASLLPPRLSLRTI